MVLLYVCHLLLTGLLGIHCGIITVKEVSVMKGGSVSIPCQYEPLYRNNVKYLCNGYWWLVCAQEIKTSQLNTSGKFSISDDTNQRIFTVTINDLSVNKHFWCAIETGNKRDVKQYFHLSVSTGMKSLNVSQQEIVAFEGESVTAVCRYNHPVKKGEMWCRLGSICVTDQDGSIDGTAVKINASVPNLFTVTMSDLRTESSGWYWCAIGDLQMPVHIIVHEVTSAGTTALRTNTNFTWRLSTNRQHSSSLTSIEPNTAQPTASIINGAPGGSLEDGYKSSTKVTILTSVLILQLLIVPVTLFIWRLKMRKNTRSKGCDVTVDNSPAESVIYSMTVINDNVQHETEPADRSVIYSTINFNNS